jgi:pyruvate dehydrogenase E1 component alpha subunit
VPSLEKSPKTRQKASGDNGKAKLNGKSAGEPVFKPAPLTKDDWLKLYYNMVMTRGIEDRVKKLYRQGKVLGGVYTSTGQEAICVGACYYLGKEDWIYPSHRDSGAYVSKGMPAWQAVANYLGKAEAPARGRDGNVHMGSIEYRIAGFISHLGCGLPVMAGAAFGFKYLKQPFVSVVFFGEGASNRGDVHEAMNFAAVHKLPVIFICNNNQYAYSTPLHLTMSVENVADRAAGYNLPGVVVDGNNVVEVCQQLSIAIQRARAGHGPTLVEAKTFRMSGHAEHDPADYVPAEMFDIWRQKDPIARHEHFMIENGVSQAEIDAVKEKVAADLLEAVEYAESLSRPDPGKVEIGVYAEQGWEVI